jgi:hypothetical protein
MYSVTAPEATKQARRWNCEMEWFVCVILIV